VIVRLLSRLAQAPVVVVLLVAPPVAHLALMMHRGMEVAGFLIALQAVLVTWIALASRASRVFRLAACAVVLLFVIVLWRFTGGGPVVASGVPHAMIYLALLTIFATSLESGGLEPGRPEREAVATMLARISRGHLSPEIVRYTRRVTWAWCWFFVAQLSISFLLLVFAPLDVWSVFINLCNLPLIVLMLGGEFVYRQWRHAADPPERLVDMVRIYRRIRPPQENHP
jgi:uncharacterized membrane protein